MRRYTAWAGEETECLLRGRAPPGGAGGSLHPACGASTPPRTREEPAHVAIDATACTARRRQARCSAKSLCSGVRGVECRARRPVVRTTRWYLLYLAPDDVSFPVIWPELPGGSPAVPDPKAHDPSSFGGRLCCLVALPALRQPEVLEPTPLQRRVGRTPKIGETRYGVPWLARLCAKRSRATVAYAAAVPAGGSNGPLPRSRPR